MLSVVTNEGTLGAAREKYDELVIMNFFSDYKQVFLRRVGPGCGGALVHGPERDELQAPDGDGAGENLQFSQVRQTFHLLSAYSKRFVLIPERRRTPCRPCWPRAVPGTSCTLRRSSPLRCPPPSSSAPPRRARGPESPGPRRCSRSPAGARSGSAVRRERPLAAFRKIQPFIIEIAFKVY